METNRAHRIPSLVPRTLRSSLRTSPSLNPRLIDVRRRRELVLGHEDSFLLFDHVSARANEKRRVGKRVSEKIYGRVKSGEREKGSGRQRGGEKESEFAHFMKSTICSLKSETDSASMEV